MKLLIVLRDTVANKVINVSVEDNELTLQRNLGFACETLKGSPLNPFDIEVICSGGLNEITGEIIPTKSLPLHNHQ